MKAITAAVTPVTAEAIRLMFLSSNVSVPEIKLPTVSATVFIPLESNASETLCAVSPIAGRSCSAIALVRLSIWFLATCVFSAVVSIIVSAAVAAAPVESIMAVMLLLNDSALESRMFAAFAPSEEENISDRDFPVD